MINTTTIMMIMIINIKIMNNNNDNYSNSNNSERSGKLGGPLVVLRQADGALDCLELSGLYYDIILLSTIIHYTMIYYIIL